MIIKVDQPHGFMRDSEGKICLRFANWDTDDSHEVPDYVEEIEYVAGPAAHQQPLHKDYVTSQ